MKRCALFLFVFLIFVVAHGQVPLPERMETLKEIFGFRDGTGYQIRSKEPAWSGLYRERNNKTIRYSDLYGKMELWSSYQDIDSPNGMNVFENFYPMGCGLGKMTKENCQEWSTHIRTFDPKAFAGGKPFKDTIISDRLFPIAITNDGLLICSKPKLKGESQYNKTELKKLTGIYTHNLKTGEEKVLFTGELALPNEMYFREGKWKLTPNSKIFCYYGDKAKIYYWDLETGKQLVITDRPEWRKHGKFTQGLIAANKPFDNSPIWRVESISDFETLITIPSDGYPVSYDQVIINHLTGEELARFPMKLIGTNDRPNVFYAANDLYSIDYRHASVTFWNRMDGDIVPGRTVQLDTTYMQDGPLDKKGFVKMQLLTPRLAAVWNHYDRLYVMELENGKSKIVYSDIHAQRRYAAEASAAKAACEERIRGMKFGYGTTIVHKNVPYIVRGYDCYADEYLLGTVKEDWSNPPFSPATIMRYDLKPVKVPMLSSATFKASDLGSAAVASKQLEVCAHCHGQGGNWTSQAVTGPSVLVNTNTKTAEYKALGTMVYNYERCKHCLGACWFVK